jgi:hypothetical protein
VFNIVQHYSLTSSCSESKRRRLSLALSQSFVHTDNRELYNYNLQSITIQRGSKQHNTPAGAKRTYGFNTYIVTKDSEPSQYIMVVVKSLDFDSSAKIKSIESSPL